MAEIKYVIGDATRPQGTGTRVICHCCNDEGGWGSGFVVALSNRWKQPERCYRSWAQEGEHDRVTFLVPTDTTPPTKRVAFQLGEAIFVQVEPNIWVANIIGQHRTIRTVEKPIRYKAIQSGLEKLAQFCNRPGDSVHMPRMGAGLARGDWATIEGLVKKELVDRGTDVTVYDLQ